jgi:tRNA (guanine-N7-)-methyltransferase
MTESKFPLRRVRSFVKRDSRMTDSQQEALKKHWPRFGLRLEDGFIDYSKVFEREAPRILEIGFGGGKSLLEMARLSPHETYIGIEMYQPGIGALLLGMELQQVDNIRIYYADAVEVLEKCIPDGSLDVIQIFFPDPWQKRKHHKRRLIQSEFVKLLTSKLKSQGTLHLATDWEDYAEDMIRVLSEAEELVNLAGQGSFAERSTQRPVVTKFEERGTRSGRKTWELQFVKRSAS